MNAWRLVATVGRIAGIALLATLYASPIVAHAQTAYTALHHFEEGPGGIKGRLIQAADGHIYGTASDAVVHRFAPGEGSYPLGGVTESNGALYGMTSAGGRSNAGVVYRIGGPGA